VYSQPLPGEAHGLPNGTLEAGHGQGISSQSQYSFTISQQPSWYEIDIKLNKIYIRIYNILLLIINSILLLKTKNTKKTGCGVPLPFNNEIMLSFADMAAPHRCLHLASKSILEKNRAPC
jgi:hypothetical protein